jgi:hypothetical protein
MFDVSGTAWMVGILFCTGLKFYADVALANMESDFVMMFLAVWIRRSNIMTGSGF